MTLPDIIDYPLPGSDSLPAAVVDWQLDPSRCALLVHDLQPYFLAPYSPALRSQLLNKAATLLEACRSAGIPVAHTHQPGDQTAKERGLLLDFWGPGPRGTHRPVQDHDARLSPVAGEAVVARRRYNAFLGTELDQWLREQGRDQLLVCGVYAHIGCLMTSAHAFMTERQPFVVADATADFSDQEHRMALEYIACRLGVVTTTDAVLEILRSSTASAATSGESLTQIRTRVAGLLGVDLGQVGADDDLAALGLDSMRRMQLVDDWSAIGAKVDFMQVMLAHTCSSLHDVLHGSAQDRV